MRSRTTNATAPNTRRIGWAKLSAEYCVAGLASGTPQSHGGARRKASEAKRWMTLAARDAEMTMNRNTSSPLYELRLSAIGAIESQAIAGLRRHSAADRRCSPTGARASMKRPGKTPAMRHRAASANIAARVKRSVSRARLRRVRARPSKKGYAERLGEAGSGERGREREQRPDRRAPRSSAPRTATPGSAGWLERSAIRRRSR